MKSLGGNKGEEFNDVGYESVKKITVGAEDVNIPYIKIEYVKNGKVEIREHGAYFSTSDNSNSGRESKSEFSTQKLDAQGGKGGNQWDDGGDHDRVTKVHVAVGRGIEQISFDYLKNRQTNEGPDHGVKGGRSSIRTVCIMCFYFFLLKECFLPIKICYRGITEIFHVGFLMFML